MTILTHNGATVQLPDHDGLTCGIYWEESCIECLLAWTKNKEWMASIPGEVKSQLAEIGKPVAAR